MLRISPIHCSALALLFAGMMPLLAKPEIAHKGGNRGDGEGSSISSTHAAKSHQVAEASVDLSSFGNPSTVPLKWTGLLLNKDIVRDGKRYNVSCTAQFISPRVLLTAAHCVQDHESGAWFDTSKMFFLLQYQNGEFTQVYRPVCLSRFDGWMPSNFKSSAERDLAMRNRYQWDYAMILVDRPSATGYFTYDLSPTERYGTATVTGYPGAVLEGQVIQRASGQLYLPNEGPNIMAVAHKHADLTQGTSGGAWIARFSKDEGTETNILVSVSSYIRPDLPGVSFGPVLTSDFITLFKYVSQGCPR